MDKSETLGELAKALSTAQERMQSASKDSTNPFFKSKYADLTSITSAIRDAIKGTGLSYIQVGHDSDHAAGIETVILHSSGQWMSAGILRVPVSKDDAQGYGSACTYARRYSLSAAFGVTTDDDDGNAATTAKPSADIKPNSGVAESLTIDQRHAMETMADEVNSRCRDGKFEDGANHIKSYDLTNEEKTFMWGLITTPFKAKLKPFLGASK